MIIKPLQINSILFQSSTALISIISINICHNLARYVKKWVCELWALILPSASKAALISLPQSIMLWSWNHHNRHHGHRCHHHEQRVHPLGAVPNCCSRKLCLHYIAAISWGCTLDLGNAPDGFYGDNGDDEDYTDDHQSSLWCELTSPLPRVATQLNVSSVLGYSERENESTKGAFLH